MLRTLSALVLLIGTSHVHGGAVRVCNIGSNDYQIAIAEKFGLAYFGSTWTMYGWYEAKADSCVNIYGDNATLTAMRIGVVKINGSEYESVQPPFRVSHGNIKKDIVTLCLPNEKFTRKGTLDELNQCSSGDESIPFHIFWNADSSVETRTLEIK